MGKITGFLEIERQEPAYEPVAERIGHWREFTYPLAETELVRQAARCMDCGIPYCHGATGCPIHNQIPDWNDLVMKGNWRAALDDLHSTNNFPEITGRICPAPCEEACTLALVHAPVAIKTIEQAIADKGWSEGWVKAQKTSRISTNRVAVIGSGPAGLAAAQQLARAGHEVHVFEREPKAGGLLRYGIPDFKLEKHIIDLRLAQMTEEGVVFHLGADVGSRIELKDLTSHHEAVLIAVGAPVHRDPQLPGQTLTGVQFAMPYLTAQNRTVGGETMSKPLETVAGRNVVVIGGGDTASDCIGTAYRQGASSVVQLDIRPCPPEHADILMSWPYWPTRLRTSTSQAEGVERTFEVVTLEIVGHEGRVTGIRCARADAKRHPIAGSEFIIPADSVFLALGFSGVQADPWISSWLDETHRLNANDKDYRLADSNLFAAGDARRGQSLVVWAIREGRQAARAIDSYLMGKSTLPG